MAKSEKEHEIEAGVPNYIQTYIHCSCNALEHVLRISYFNDDLETCYIETIAPATNIFYRAWQAFKWVLGFQVVFGETVLGKKEAIQLRDRLDEFLKDEETENFIQTDDEETIF